MVRVAVRDTAGLGVAAEGNDVGADRPLSFSSYPRDRRFVDVFNTGFLANFDDRVARGGADWRTVRGLGRKRAAVEAVPSTAAPTTGDLLTRAPELTYRIRFTSAGTFPVTVFRLPSLDERGKRRLAIALDDGPAVVLSGQAIATGNRGDAWARNVEEGVEKLTGSVTVTRPGDHELRLLMVDPGMAVDQIVLNTGGLPATYLAPPESYHRRAAYREVPDGSVELEDR